MGSMEEMEYRFTLNDGDSEYDDSNVYEGESDGYSDEEYYDDEYYEDGEDDGYSDDPKTYDGEYDSVLPDEDKLGRVLNELAELRRSVGVYSGSGSQPPVVASYAAVPSYAPSYAPVSAPVVVTPQSPVSSGNEIALFHEITRLREEINKVNSVHEMHVELARLKEDMERESRQKEAQLQEEIRRLNDKISELSGKE